LKLTKRSIPVLLVEEKRRGKGATWAKSVKKHQVQECHLITGQPTKRICPFNMQLATLAIFGHIFCAFFGPLGGIAS